MNDSMIFNNYKNEIYEKYLAKLISVSDYKFVHRTIIEFECTCGILQSIQYRLILKRGAFCRKCCYTNSIKKRKITIENSTTDVKNKLYDKLSKIEMRDNCVIFNKSTINNNSIVRYQCNCGTVDETNYRNIKIRGGYCRKCSIKTACEKRKNTFIKKYGTSHSTNTPHIIEKIKNTNMLRYGVEHPAQNPFVDCNTYKTKKYITKTGKIYIIQGYENLALTELLEYYSDSDIVMGKSLVPKINYEFNNTNKVYYPDIYIPKENKIIEVKSDWTFNVQKDRNILKAIACSKLKYKYEFWIYDNKKNKKIIAY